MRIALIIVFLSFRSVIAFNDSCPLNQTMAQLDNQIEKAQACIPDLERTTIAQAFSWTIFVYAAALYIYFLDSDNSIAWKTLPSVFVVPFVAIWLSIAKDKLLPELSNSIDQTHLLHDRVIDLYNQTNYVNSTVQFRQQLENVQKSFQSALVYNYKNTIHGVEITGIIAAVVLFLHRFAISMVDALYWQNENAQSKQLFVNLIALAFSLGTVVITAAVPRHFLVDIHRNIINYIEILKIRCVRY